MIEPDYFDASSMREVERPVRELLRNVTYRPGWEFCVEHGQVVAHATVIDANNPRQEIPLKFGVAIPRYAGVLRHDFDWTSWFFREVIMVIERHEAQEFFRIDGKPVYDPHPELEHD